MNNDILDAGGSGANQALLLTEALKTDLMIPQRIISNDSCVKVEKGNHEIYYPSKSYIDLIREVDPDVLLIHFMSLDMLREMEKIKEHCRVVTVSHENIFDLLITDAKRPVLPYFIQFLDQSDLVICLSEDQEKVLSNVVNTKLRVIPPAIEYHKYKNIEANSLSNEFTMGGRLVQIKNHITPFLAMKKVAKKYPDVFLKVYEDGMLRQCYEALLSQLNLTQHIGLFGLVSHDQFISNMCLSKALLMSSLNENNPLVCLEAQALGIPIIEENCFSPDAYSLSMIDVLDNYELYKAKAEAERKYVEKYDIGIIKKRYEKVLKEVL